MLKRLLFLLCLQLVTAGAAFSQAYLCIDNNNVPGAVPADTLMKPIIYNASATGMSANGTITIPKGKTILQVVIQNTGSAGMIGGLKIGTTAGAADVVSALTVPGNSLFSITDSQLLRRVFSMSADQVLYLQAVTGWNGASLNVYFVLKSLN